MYNNKSVIEIIFWGGITIKRAIYEQCNKSQNSKGLHLRTNPLKTMDKIYVGCKAELELEYAEGARFPLVERVSRD